MPKICKIPLLVILVALAACGSERDRSSALIDRFFDADQAELESVILPELIELAQNGDVIATDFLGEALAYGVEDISVQMRNRILSLLAEHRSANTAAFLAIHETNGAPDFSKLYDLSAQALDHCHLVPDYYLALYNPPVFNPSDFFSITWRDADSVAVGMAKIGKCRDYYGNFEWLEGELRWELEGNNSGMNSRLKDLESLWRFFPRNSRYTDERTFNRDLLSELIPDNQSSELYLNNLFVFPDAGNLDEVIPQLRRDALSGDSTAARSLGIYYSGQSRLIRSDLLISLSQAETASPWFNMAADSDPVSKFYLWALKFGRAGSGEASEFRYLLIESIQAGFFIPACMALGNFPIIAEELSEAFATVPKGKILEALSEICEVGYMHQLDLFRDHYGLGQPSAEIVSLEALEPGSYSRFPRHPAVAFGSDANSNALIQGSVAIGVSLFFLYLAFLTFEANSRNTKNKSIALILSLEGLLLLSMFGFGVLPVSLASLGLAQALLTLIPFVAVGLTVSYLMFLSVSGTLIGRFFSIPVVQYGIPVLVALFLLWFHFSWGYGVYPVFAGDSLTLNLDFEFMRFIAALFLGFHLTILGNLIFSYILERKTKEVKSETRYYLAAYLARFCFIAFTMTSLILASFGDGLSTTEAQPLISSFIAGETLYGTLFAYGILHGELFGVKRLVKRGVVKVIIVCILFGTYYAIEELVSANFSEVLGNLAGLFSAALVFLFEKPISKKAFRVVDLLIPDENEITESERAYLYLYRLAIEDGVVSADEARMLEFTAESLKLTRGQIEAIESKAVNMEQYRTN